MAEVVFQLVQTVINVIAYNNILVLIVKHIHLILIIAIRIHVNKIFLLLNDSKWCALSN